MIAVRGWGSAVSLENLEALEKRVKKLVDLVIQLREDNTQLEEQLQWTREQLAKRGELTQEWEEERAAIRSRIEKVLDELEFLDHSDDAPGGGT